MFDDVVEDVTAHVERNASAKMDELNELVAELLSWRAKETSVKDQFDAVKVLLSGIETCFQAGHAALVEAINAQALATKAQTIHLEALCKMVRMMNEKKGVLCSYVGGLGTLSRTLQPSQTASK